MADYLTRLASRTLGLTPVAEPVVAPLFAPEEPATTVSDSSGVGEEIQVQSDPGIVPVRHSKSSATLQKKDDLPVAPPSQPTQRSKAAPHPLPVGEGSPDLGSPSFAEGGSQPTAGPPLQDSRSEGTPDERLAPPLPALLARRKPPAGPVRAGAAKTTEPESPFPPEEPSAGAAETSLPDRSRPMVHPAVSIAVSGKEPGATFPPPEASPHLEKLEAPSALPDGSKSIFSRPLAPVPPPETLTEPLLVPPASAEISLSRQALPVVGRQPVAAPKLRDQEPPATIEITIGRVDVHAVYPPAPATRPRVAGPAPPRLSLEEYLRNQNGGRR